MADSNSIYKQPFIGPRRISDYLNNVHYSIDHYRRRPALGDRFTVQGAKQWKTDNKIEEVIYAGERSKISSDSSDGIEVGTLIYLWGKDPMQSPAFYVIKATTDKIYICEEINGKWTALGTGTMKEWVELKPGVSRVRLISDPEKMKKLCKKVGNSWGPVVHHMNGNEYTVVENLPPSRYVVYDPVCDAKGIQNGKIFVPYNGVFMNVQDLKGGVFFGGGFELFGPKRFEPAVMVVWPCELVRLIQNCLENIFIIYHMVIRRLEKFLSGFGFARWRGCCACGEIQMKILGKPWAIYKCHCSTCRNQGLPSGGITFIAYNGAEVQFQSRSTGAYFEGMFLENGDRRFCNECNTLIFMKYKDGYIYVDSRRVKDGELMAKPKYLSKLNKQYKMTQEGISVAHIWTKSESLPRGYKFIPKDIPKFDYDSEWRQRD